jgi:hypothetical protein
VTYNGRNRNGNTYSNSTIYYKRNRLAIIAQQGGIGFLIALVLAFGVYYTMSPKGLSGRADDIKQRVTKLLVHGNPTVEPTNPTEQASVASHKVSLVSSPPSAEIWIDGALIRDVTPTTHVFESGREYAITIRKEHYIPWQRRMRFTRDGEKLSVTLPRARVAFVDIIVVGSGEIYINDKKVANAGPIMGVQIPADEDVLIRSFDTRTGAAAEEHVRLGEGFSKRVTLYPKILVPTPPLQPNGQ